MSDDKKQYTARYRFAMVISLEQKEKCDKRWTLLRGNLQKLWMHIAEKTCEYGLSKNKPYSLSLKLS